MVKSNELCKYTCSVNVSLRKTGADIISGLNGSNKLNEMSLSCFSGLTVSALAR